MSGPGRIVIVGAGVVGASVAFHLARAGASDVVVLDAAPGPGHGSTGKATGGFRAQFASAINVRLSLLARDKLRRFQEEVGADSGYAPVGYLWLASSSESLQTLRAARAVQRACGLDEAVEVDRDDIVQLQPSAARDGILGGAFCPTDGYIVPLAMLAGYLAAAAREGVRFLWDEPVERFDRRPDGRIKAVVTRRASVGCDAVVDAAGAWAAAVAALAGCTVPISPLRRQVAMTRPTDRLPADAPMTIWCEDGFHARPRDGRVLLAFPSPGDPSDPWGLGVESSWLREVARLKDARLPGLSAIALDPGASWAGLYEMTPDRHAVLGPLDDCPNLVIAGGNSGHGVMHAPALGQLVAEILTAGEATSLDVRALRPSRFAENDLNPQELL